MSSARCSLADLLAPARGIIAVIGSGGKSTLLARGGHLLAQRGSRVVLATSTHMYAPVGIPHVETLEELDHALIDSPIACIGPVETSSGKLVAPARGFDALARRADYVLVEADGSHGLPLKAHASHEPVIPAGSAMTVLLVGASGFGKPIEQVVHRPQRFCELTGAKTDDAATPELVAAAIAAEGFVGPNDLVIVNQVEEPAALHAAEAFQRTLDRPVYAGSLRDKGTVLLSRLNSPAKGAWPHWQGYHP